MLYKLPQRQLWWADQSSDHQSRGKGHSNALNAKTAPIWPNVKSIPTRAQKGPQHRAECRSCIADLDPCTFFVQFMDKRLAVALQGGRRVSGVLRGFDIFLNLVIDDAFEESTSGVNAAGGKTPLGQIVSPGLVRREPSPARVRTADHVAFPNQIIRGNSVTSLETLENVR